MKYAIYGNLDKIKKEEIKNEILEIIKTNKISFKEGLFYDENDPNYVFSFGGDGTMLRALHEYLLLEDVKFIGIKMGSLGFFADFEANELALAIKSIASNNYKENKYSLLEYKINKDLDEVKGYAINEVTLINPVHTQIIEVYIDEVLFETFRGTGLLICPPTGSTAYNKSLGGSILDPKIEAFQLTEIAALNNTVYKSINSPLVLNKNTKLILKTNESKNIYMSVDGEELNFSNLSKIEIKLSDKKINIISKKESLFWRRVEKAFIK